jgi:glycosyltransferase involved in cell wall biosynthesis
MNEVFNPKVSIVIPVYNGGNFLAQAIDSALAQTYSNIEILVINDGSNDDGETRRIALSYGDKIQFFEKPNGGVASALNMAIEKMSGEYFSWLSHDDLYVNEKVARQMAVLSSLPASKISSAIVYSDFSIFTTDPEDTAPILMRGVPPEEFRFWLTIESALHGCTLLIPKIALVEMKCFNESLHTTQDYDLWFRMAEKYCFVHLPERLVKSRSHPKQGTRTMPEVVAVECNALFTGFVNQLTVDELSLSSTKPLALAYAQISSSLLHRGFHNAGRAAMRLSFANFSKDHFYLNIWAIIVVVNGAFLYCIVKPARGFISLLVNFARTLIPRSLRLAIKKIMIG